MRGSICLSAIFTWWHIGESEAFDKRNAKFKLKKMPWGWGHGDGTNSQSSQPVWVPEVESLWEYFGSVLRRTWDNRWRTNEPHAGCFDTKKKILLPLKPKWADARSSFQTHTHATAHESLDVGVWTRTDVFSFLFFFFNSVVFISPSWPEQP